MVKDPLRHVWRTLPGSLLVLSLWASLSWAGAGEPEPKATKEMVAQVQPAVPASPRTPAAAAPKTKPVAKAVSKGKGAKKAAEPEAVAPSKRKLAVVGRRDPFKLPPPPSPGGAEGEVVGPLPPGTRGLVINRLRVEGIVRLDIPNTMIAVVDDNRNRAYFLREKDAVYNGFVSKITPDSVIFTENVLDQEGRVKTREVVKRLGPGPGEGR